MCFGKDDEKKVLGSGLDISSPGASNLAPKVGCSYEDMGKTNDVY